MRALTLEALTAPRGTPDRPASAPPRSEALPNAAPAQATAQAATGRLVRRAAAAAARTPAWLECLVVLGAVALLLPAFELVAEFGAGRDQRFAAGAAKDAAMLALQQTAGWQWAGAMLLGYGFVVLSRLQVPPALGVALAAACWAAAGWLGRVPWPFAGSRGFEPARLDADLASRPALFIVVLAVAAALLLAVAAHRAREGRAAAVRRQAMSSRVGYAGLVLATGLGWLLLLDLSAHAHAGNRYLALYHQGHLWLGMLVFSALLFVREPMSRGLGFALAVAGEGGRVVTRRLGRAGAVALLLLLAVGAVVAFGATLSNLRQLTSELGRVWLIVGAAWFFFLRAGPLADRLARGGSAGASFWRYVWPLALVIGVLLLAMLVTRDMGPLLIAGYAAGAFLAATVAMWWHLRGASTPAASLLAMGLFAAWIGATTFALFTLGAADEVTAARLESLASPLASNNDQLALVAWFQRAAPVAGFGIGSVPWCGWLAAGSCGGVPAQIHSDYTFTAIVGLFGMAAAWAAAIGTALWLHRLVRHHGRVTRGEPRFLPSAGLIANDGQALLSWIGVAWVVLTLCQLAVTVAGNVAVLPLTGVTFPFVGYGMTSLVVNLAFLALAINLTLPVVATDDD